MLTLHFGLDDVGVSETSIFLFRINTFMIHGNYTVSDFSVSLFQITRACEGREVKWYYWQWSLQILLSYCPIYISARSLSHHSDVATVVVLAIKKWWIQTFSNYEAAFGNENVGKEPEFSFRNAAQTRLVDTCTDGSSKQDVKPVITTSLLQQSLWLTLCFITDIKALF